MSTSTAPTITVHRFWTAYEPDLADPSKLRGVDWVAYGPMGKKDMTVSITRISQLNRLQPLAGSNNPAVQMAHERWALIEKHYNAWKLGQEVPLEGTPLAAWNAISPEEAEVFKVHGIRTVEEIALLTETHVTRIGLPKMSDRIRAAKNFLDAAEQHRLASRLNEKDGEVEQLRAENAESRAQINALMAKIDQLATMVADRGEEEAEGEAEPAKRGPGRPRKADQATAAA